MMAKFDDIKIALTGPDSYVRVSVSENKDFGLNLTRSKPAAQLMTINKITIMTANVECSHGGNFGDNTCRKAVITSTTNDWLSSMYENQSFRKSLVWVNRDGKVSTWNARESNYIAMGALRFSKNYPIEFHYSERQTKNPENLIADEFTAWNDQIVDLRDDYFIDRPKGKATKIKVWDLYYADYTDLYIYKHEETFMGVLLKLNSSGDTDHHFMLGKLSEDHAIGIFVGSEDYGNFVGKYYGEVPFKLKLDFHNRKNVRYYSLKDHKKLLSHYSEILIDARTQGSVDA
jgi:hypothetical protein